MDEDTIKYFKRMLEERWEELTSDSGKILSNLEEYTTGSQEPMDSVDFASSQSAVELTLKIQNRNRQLMREIQAALKRIEDGEFGVCDECGDDISVGRLKVQPVATLCIDCKKKLENVGRSSAM